MSLLFTAVATIEMKRFGILESVYAYPARFEIRFVLSYLVVLLFAFFSERAREHSQTVLSAKNVELSEKIGELLAAETALQKVQSELEQRVEERTNQLKHSNTKLMNEVLEKQNAEKALKESQERLVLVLDSIGADIYVSDMQTYEILFMNKHMAESFGCDHTGETCWQAFRNATGVCPDCPNAKTADGRWPAHRRLCLGQP